MLNDSDQDGLVNYLDIDSDNDGITDHVESMPTQGFISPVGLDGDGDGLDDSFDADDIIRLDYLMDQERLLFINNELDPFPDYLDLDADNDGEADNIEGHDFDRWCSRYTSFCSFC